MMGEGKAGELMPGARCFMTHRATSLLIPIQAMSPNMAEKADLFNTVVSPCADRDDRIEQAE